MNSQDRVMKIIATVFLAMTLVSVVIVQALYKIKAEPLGMQWLYSWMQWAVLIAGVITIVAIVLVWISTKKKIKWIIFVAAVVIGIGVVICKAVTSNDIFTNRSPNHRRLLVLEVDDKNGAVTFDRTYLGFLRKSSEQFPYTVVGEKKIQWITNDVCAITYKSTDNKVHEYIATYGSRGNDISYIDPMSSVSGNWTIKDTNHAGWELQILGGKISLKNGSKEWTYDSDEVVRFGTTALALCKDGYPQWNIILNENCKINEDGLIAKGGTITLCEVSMNKTAPIEFVCTDVKSGQSGANVNQVEASGQWAEENFSVSAGGKR